MLRLLLVAGLFAVAVGCYLVACWLLCPGQLRKTPPKRIDVSSLRD